uniref:Uncharacterized protein n=1 Tax=Tylopilus plumbeoviolaceoides TaxID=374766 RepID=A0A8F0WP42_9AGAM|nr:hypothetical protein KYW48_mgp10 [Tylopilus plumbeoviolaceoides]QWM97172.1 hypothetical protein [Tylopilus plumbeoviolaceoides]
MSNKLQNIFKYLALANFSMATYNLVINQTKNNELTKSLELERDKINNELKELINNNNSKKINDVLENVEITENKIEEIRRSLDEVIKTSDNKSESITSQLENLDNKIKILNNDLYEIFKKVENYINSEENYINFNIINEFYSYIENLNIIQNIAFMNISAIIFIFFSLISLLTIFFGEYLINKFNIENKYPKIYKFIKIRRIFQTYYIIIDSIIIIIIIIILLIVNFYLLLYS